MSNNQIIKKFWLLCMPVFVVYLESDVTGMPHVQEHLYNSVDLGIRVCMGYSQISFVPFALHIYIYIYI
jgi:hypothetical protein